jgi:uncharacterized membrane protein
MFNTYSIIPLALLFIVCDLPWLYITRKWAQKMFEKIQGGAPLRVRWEGVPIVYVALAVLIQNARSTGEAGVIGVATYSIYEFTNYSTLANYDLQFAIADSLWGGALFILVRSAGIYFNLL